MCAIMEELKNESEQRGEQKRAIMAAQNMIAEGLGTVEQVARITGLTVDTVRELAGKKTA